MTEAEIETRDLQGWLECQSTGIARRLKLAFDPELLAKKLVIQQQLINLAQEIEAVHGRETKKMDKGLDENGTGQGGGPAQEQDFNPV